MSKIKIPKEEMLEILWGSQGKVLRHKTVNNSRWSIHYKLIFQRNDDGPIYRANYSVGATEYQDERPWQDEKEVECIEVKAVEKVIVDYEDIK